MWRFIPLLILSTACEGLPLDPPDVDQPLPSPEEQVLTSRIQQLLTGGIDVRREAADALALLGPKAAPAVPSLILALTDKNAAREDRSDALGWAATFALSAIGPEAVPALSEALYANDDSHARVGITHALLAMRGEAHAATPSVTMLLDDRSPLVRRIAATTLGRIGRDTEIAVPALIDALSDPNEDVRQSAANSLGVMRGKAESAIIDLCRILDDEAGRGYVITALRRICEAVGCDWRALVAANVSPARPSRTPACEAITDRIQCVTRSDCYFELAHCRYNCPRVGQIGCCVPESCTSLTRLHERSRR